MLKIKEKAMSIPRKSILSPPERDLEALDELLSFSVLLKAFIFVSSALELFLALFLSSSCPLSRSQAPWFDIL